ncbi:MAG: hypothetical protein KUG71_05970 [Porticoccaceae bacterium]|nr:hypothetical protein [Porticoccaceae bacterium]
MLITRQLALIALLLLCPALASALESSENLTQTDSWSESEGNEWDNEDWGSDEESEHIIHGFVEAAYGTRLHSNQWLDRHDTLNEARLRLDYSHYFGAVYGSYKGDFLVDDLAWNGPFIETQTREALLRFSFSQNSDIQLGRQILTWGTGDLVFLNDLFPKNWVAFFSGREMEYLKAPSDAIKFSYFNKLANIDLVWSPEFDPDTYMRGERFSYFSPLADSIVAAPPRLSVDEPDTGLDDGELALRLYKTIKGYEWAVYGYHGYFKSPVGFDPRSGLNYFPKLSSVGASVRGTVGRGIGNMEIAWYQSEQDRDGTDPFIPNSQLRFLSGYEQELITRLTLGLQYYLEWTQDYDQLKDNSLLPDKEPEEYRHVLTTRINYRSPQEKLTLSLFVFYSPTDDDFFALPKLIYRLSDSWSSEVGINIMGGKEDFTFFGQFEENSSVFTRIRYSF